MLIGSTLGRLAVTRARAEAVIGQLDSRLKSSERELRTGAADHDRTKALTDECASLDDPEAWPFFHANECAHPRLPSP